MNGGRTARDRPPRLAGTIVIDGDDTLWSTQPLYEEAKSRFVALLEELGNPRDVVAAKFAEIDVANVARFGFSSERFPTSMQDTYAFFSSAASRSTRPEIVAAVLEIGRSVFRGVATVRADAGAALSALRGTYRLVLFTAGDEAVQLKRIEESRLGSYFASVRIPPQKTLEQWRALLKNEGLDSATDWSIGNSFRSDIRPALQLGLRAVLVASQSWEYEAPDYDVDSPGMWRAATLDEAAHLVLSSAESWTQS